MTNEIDIGNFAARLRSTRGKRGLRETAQEIGQVSASTLSRLETGHIPDLDTFVRVCRWLGVSPDEFIMEKSNLDEVPAESKRTLVTAHLRADRTLDPRTAEALVRMIELAYEQSERGELKEVP